MGIKGALSLKSNPTRYKARYPWDEWFSGRRFTLHEGRDFSCTQGGMTLNVRNESRKRGLRVRIDQGRGSITVTVKEG